MADLKTILRSLFGRGPHSRATTASAETQIRILSEVTRAVGSSLQGPDAAHRLITEAVTTLLHVERSILFIPRGDYYQAVAASGIVDPATVNSLKVPKNTGAIGTVFATGRTLFIADTSRPPVPLSDLVQYLGAQSLLIAPLKQQNEVLGVITADTRRDGQAFKAEDVRLLEVFGSFAALVASEAKVIAELRQRNTELDRLLRLMRELNDAADPNVVLERVLHTAVELTNSTSGTLVFVDASQRELVIRASAGLPRDIAKSLKLKIGQGVTGWVAREGKSARIDDVRSDERYIAASKDIRSELAVPILGGGGNDVIGVINVDSTQTDAYSPRHQDVLESLAELAAAKLRLALAAAEGSDAT